MPGAEHVGGTLGDDAGQVLTGGQHAGLGEGLEPALLGFDPILIGRVAEALFLLLERGGNFCFDCLTRFAQEGLHAPREEEPGPKAGPGRRGEKLSGGLGHHGRRSFEGRHGRRAQGEMGATGDDGDGEEAGIRSDQNEEGVGRRFL